MLEDNSSGNAHFTVTRSGSGREISEPLTVNLQAANNTDLDAATSGEDYQPINSITIPANQTQATKYVVAINDVEPEGTENITKELAQSASYVLSNKDNPPATAHIKDEPNVISATVMLGRWDPETGEEHSYVDGKAPNGYYFEEAIQVLGEDLDDVQWLQRLLSVTTIQTFDGKWVSSKELGMEASGDYQTQVSVDTGGEFKPDANYDGSPQDFSNYLHSVFNSNGGLVYIVGDVQRAGEPYEHPVKAPAWNNAIINHNFNDQFKNSLTGVPFGLTVNWNYQFTNASYFYDGDLNYKIHDASPWANGNANSLLNGSLPGLSGIPYRADITGDNNWYS